MDLIIGIHDLYKGDISIKELLREKPNTTQAIKSFKNCDDSGLRSS